MRSDELQMLLDLSSAIATVRNKDELFRVIFEKLNPLFNYPKQATVVTIDPEERYFQLMLSEIFNMPASEVEFYKTHQFEIAPPLRHILHAEEGLVFQTGPLIEKYPEAIGGQFVKKLGTKEVISCRMQISGKIIGAFMLLSDTINHFTKKQLPFFKAVTDIIAPAVSNILANREIQLREFQKSQLLSISTHIATVRDKNDLFHLLAEEVRSFAPFDDAVIALVDDKQEQFRIFLSDVAGTTNLHKEYKQAITQYYPIEKGSVPYQIIQSGQPLIINIKKELFKNPKLQYLQFAYEFGMREELATRLMHSGKVIGLFALLSKQENTYSEKDIATLHSLSSLITIALNNILANDEIEKLSSQLALDNQYLSEEIKSNYNFEEIIGESKLLQEVFKKVVQVAHADSTVLILGETGTGKELISRAIHNLSSRKSRPLIKVNCASLPAQLIESELFGHEKGSFTGATDKRTGKFELAHNSTIFLDEIGELPLELQAKLLRVIQEKEIERIGGEKTIKVDVRIIAATNRILEKEVSNGKFRSDLYYRLNIYPIELPPLRERKEDIPLLAAYFVQKLSKKLGKKITSIAPIVMNELVSNNWPGNIRELEHTIERSMLLTEGKTITNLHLSKPVMVEVAPAQKSFIPKTLANNERELILQTLKHTKGKIRGVDGAAQLLDILPTTLEARMKKLGIKKEFIET